MKWTVCWLCQYNGSWHHVPAVQLKSRHKYLFFFLFFSPFFGVVCFNMMFPGILQDHLQDI